jgi:hypothetical protein
LNSEEIYMARFRGSILSSRPISVFHQFARRFAAFFLLSLISFCSIAAQQLPDAPSTQKQQAKTKPSASTSTAEKAWPRTFTKGGDTFSIYQPQVDKWDGNRLYLYSAVEVQNAAKKSANYGVIWFNARAEVDKVNRAVTLDQLQLTKVNFPAEPSKNDELTQLLNAKLPYVTKTVSLDRLMSATEADGQPIKQVEVKNDPPTFIFTTKPAVLVLIDGPAQMRQIEGTELQRVINTKAILLFENDKKQYYLRVSDWWLQAQNLEGPWTYAKKLPDDMKKAEEYIVDKTGAQTLQTGQSPTASAQSPGQATKPQPSLKEAGKNAEIPAVYVAFAPAELLETRGDPVFKVISGANFEYAENTNGDFFRLNGQYYVLISGRWFKGPSWNGPWTFVSAADMPPEFAKISETSPKANVLASVPGTPQAKEGLIANAIPQTATITRSEAKLTVVYDGQPMFAAIEGTSMFYAKNTSAPVIKLNEYSYYCVEAGVWFKASTPQGPWTIVDTVPEEIYTIPPSSPVYYVTYVKVYNSTPEVVYVGYTPGYYGTVVSASTNTVVYGTGWYYAPYISSTVWYGWPYTYGVGANFTWSDSTGWSFGFGYGYAYYPWYYPWWGPMGYYGYGWYPYYGWGAWGGAAVANVYGVWGNTAYSRTGAAWANPYTGNYGAATRGSYYNTQTGRSTVAGRGYNTNIYTGNTAGYRGAATYNPNTGIVAGGGAGYAGNIYSGQGTAGRGGFAYNTNTNAGVAAGKNNVYAGKDGTVYRYNRQSGDWSSNSGSGWQSTTKPDANLQRQQQMRNQGAQRTQTFNSTRGNYGTRMGGGGGRMGGGRRR